MLKNEEEIEYLIKFLHHFFSISSKRKLKLIKNVGNENVDFSRWLFSIRDFDVDMQLQLYEELRSANW